MAEPLSKVSPAPPAVEQAAPIGIVRAVTTLLCCQLAGEALALLLRQLWSNLIVPGPVLGMAICFLYLVWRKGPGRNLDVAGTAILGNLSLLFIPAAVGVIQHGHVLSQFGLVLAGALVVSTLLTLVATAGTFLIVTRYVERRHN